MKTLSHHLSPHHNNLNKSSQYYFVGVSSFGLSDSDNPATARQHRASTITSSLIQAMQPCIAVEVGRRILRTLKTLRKIDSTGLLLRGGISLCFAASFDGTLGTLCIF